MALMMVSQDLTIKDVENPNKDIAFPDSVVSMMRGELSQMPGGFPAGIQKKVLKGETPIDGRASAEMEPADLDAIRSTLTELLNRQPSENELAAYNMYPKVYTDFVHAQDQYGPTSVLPTPVYFYGLQVGDEIFVEIEQGKTLVIRCLAIGDVNDKGMVRVFFELNGQPRSIAVPDRLHGAAGAAARPKAEPGNAEQVGAPMPGVVSTVNVKAGQSVEAGDVLLSIEAMKMETAIYAEIGGVIEELLVKGGDQIDAKDLMVRIVPAD